MKKIVFLLALLPAMLYAQRDWSTAKVTTTELAPGVFRLFVDDRVSVVAHVGTDGVLLVDAAYEQTVPQLKQAVASLTDLPIRYLINTHIHGDHTGGNVGLGQGVDIIAHHNVKTFLGTERVQGDRTIPAYPAYAQPNITFSDELSLDFNGETLQLYYLPEGHTNSDIIVYLPESKVLIVGDLLFADNFPFVDVNNGGHPMGFLRNLEWITQEFPEDVLVNGGHGPVYTMSEYADYLQTLWLTVNAVKEAKQKGLSAEQMKAQRILKEWEDMGKFFITEDRWIDTLVPFL